MRGKKVKMLRELLRKDGISINAEPYRRHTKTMARRTQSGRKFYQDLKKVFCFIIMVGFFCSLSVADEIQVPYSCYPKELQKDFSDKGYKLDLSANDRTKDSWGFLDSKGTEFYIYTYESVTMDDLETIKKIVFEGI